MSTISFCQKSSLPKGILDPVLKYASYHSQRRGVRDPTSRAVELSLLRKTSLFVEASGTNL